MQKPVDRQPIVTYSQKKTIANIFSSMLLVGEFLRNSAKTMGQHFRAEKTFGFRIKTQKASELATASHNS